MTTYVTKWRMLIAGLIVVLAVILWWTRPFAQAQLPQQPALISLEAMGHIVSVKVNYANVIEFSQKVSQGIPWTFWELTFGSSKVLLVARGDCLVGTDFRNARYEDKNEVSRTVVLSLPSPTPISARVNHDAREKGGSYFYAMSDTGIVPFIPGSASRTMAVDGALGIAQRQVEEACRSAEVVTTAKKNTEELMRPTYLATGWKTQIKWR